MKLLFILLLANLINKLGKMPLQPEINNLEKKGCIEVICGPMFSGKTEELLKRVKLAKAAKLNISVFKPKIDTRYSTHKIVSHNSNEIIAQPVTSAKEILKLSYNTQVLAIDEAQFFDNDLLSVCNKLANNGVKVIVSGLDMDFLGRPFGVMPKLLAVAEHILKLNAICNVCNNAANYSYRNNNEKMLVKLGEKQSYKALCRVCFLKNNEKVYENNT